MKLPLLFAALVALAAAPPAPSPIELHFPLPEGGLYEEWTVQVPQFAGPIERVELDVRGYVRSYHLQYESLWLGPLPLPSWAFLWGDVRFGVWVDGDPKRAHVDWAWLYQATPILAPWYDGHLDYSGESGVTMPDAQIATVGAPSVYAHPERFEGTGSAPVRVVAPATFITFASLSPAYASSQRIYGGGELVVRIYP